MSIIKIVSRWDSARVLFECDVPESIDSGLAVRHALEQATKSGADLRGADLRGAYLRGADLSGAYLRDADLSGADLRGADLRGAYLRGADLRDAYLRGAYLRDADLSGADLSGADLRGADLRGAYLSGAEPATPEQAVENLDRVREIILDNRDRLEMGHWHGSEQWRERTCAEETICGTTHCLAGWLQVCSTDPKVRDMEPFIAGAVAAPIAAKMFYRRATEVLPWLEERRYVQEIAEREARRAERAAAKAGEQA
jgi:hypothetical protein